MPVGTGKCGTYAGFMQHRRLQTPICLPCRAADALWKQDRRQAPRRRAVLLEALAGFDKYPTGRRAGAA
jgi:hypothetical protein